MRFRMPDVDHIRLPGDERARRKIERDKNGIPIPEQLFTKLDVLSDELGINQLERKM